MSNHRLIRSLAVGVALTASLGLASPALASTTQDGCTVTPQVPAFSGSFNASGVKLVNYAFDVTCQAGLLLDWDQKRMEADTLAVEGKHADDVTGSSSGRLDFTTGSLSRTVTVRAPLPNGANEGNDEEVYQKVRFQVTNPPTVGMRTSWERTVTRTILR